MNNKGFMSVTMIYSFFLVFLMILLLMMSESVSEKISLNKIKNSIKNDVAEVTLSEYIQNLYTGTQGENNLYYHDASLTNGAEDNSYRYSGANPDNYVCFGSDESPCLEDNLYRIIYVKEGQVKLIKATVANKNLLGMNGDYTSNTVYRWNYKADTTINKGQGSNDWGTSLLNKINLNTNYIDKIGETWASKIATTEWQVGGTDWSNVSIAGIKNLYLKEMTTNASATYSAKIGLMYASDYGFATSQKYWGLPGYKYNSNDIRKGKNENWLYTGNYEWTITRNSSDAYDVLLVYYTGEISNAFASYSNNVVRPVFNLQSSVTYKSGDGTKINPYRIN